jgi:uncharacterized delta-60 repeat protein
MKRYRTLAGTALVLLVASLIAAIPAARAEAAPGDLDPTFSDDGISVAGIGASDFGSDVAVQPDGKLVVVGGSYAAGVGWRFALARFERDGSLDTSFGGPGWVTTESNNAAASAVALRPDGLDDKIVVAGGQTVARYNSDGSPDKSFGVGGIVTTGFDVLDTQVDHEGRVLVSGYEGVAVARYLPNGTPDPSFGVNGKVSGQAVSGIATAMLDGVEKIVTVGVTLARYNDDGSLDMSFNGDGWTTIDIWGEEDALSGVAIEPDGTIVTVGDSYCFECSSTVMLLALFGSDGSLGGVEYTDIDGLDRGSNVAVAPDGQIAAVGFTADAYLVARYNANGAPDSSFGPNHDGVQITDFGGGGMAVQADSKIVTAGGAYGHMSISRYQAGSPPVNLRPPSISGTAVAGDTLSAIPGDWANSAGPSSYQWLTCDAAGANCANLSGATTNQYVLGPADIGRYIAVRETATNADGPSTAQSAVTPVVSGTLINSRLPAISGTAILSQTLTAIAGGWSTMNVTHTFQWRRCDVSGSNCLDIAGASSESYVLLAADVGHTIRVRDTVTITTAGLQNWADSAPTGVVASGVPANLSPPVIAGTPANGQTLSVTAGTWSTSDITRSIQWKRCDSAGTNCADVGGGATSYALPAADVGHTIRVRETASNANGTASADSTPTAAVRPKPGGIAGQVTYGNKKWIAGATVGCGVAGTTTTNANGGYSLMMLPPGTYRCTAGATGYTAKTQTVTVKAGNTTTANFTLVRSWTARTQCCGRGQFPPRGQVRTEAS